MPYKVKFDTGEVVTFDQQPSDADIEEVVKKHNIKAKVGTEIPAETITPAQNQKPEMELTEKIASTPYNLGIGALKGGIQTIQNMANLGEKVLYNTVGKGMSKITGKDVRPGIAQIPKKYTDPTNTMQSIGKGIEQVAEFALPGGAAGKLATGAEKVISIIPKIPKLGKGALVLASKMGLGAAETGGVSALQTGGDKEAIKNSAVVGGVFPVLGVAKKAAGQSLQSIGKKIGFSVIKPTLNDIKDGFKIDNVYKYNIGGSLEDTITNATKRMNSLGKELKAKIGQSKNNIDLTSIFDETAKKLGGNQAEQFGRISKIDGALKNLQNEILIQGKMGTVDLPTAQTVKRAAGTMGAWKFGMQDPESLASEKVYNTFYSALKNEIEKKSPAGVKEINKQLQELIPIYNAAIRRLPIAERNNAISLSDIITLTGSALDPKALGITVINKAVKSGKVGNILVKKGQGLQQASKIAPLIKGAIIKTITGK